MNLSLIWKQPETMPCGSYHRRTIYPWIRILTLLAFPAALLAASGESPPAGLWAGAARTDITPSYPIRLSGYGGRTTASEGISQRLWAKALAFGRQPGETSVLITVDNTGVPESITEAVYRRLSARKSFPRENFTLCSSHTHNGPMLAGMLPFLFSKDMDAREQATINRYTGELILQLEEVAWQALENRQPARLGWGEGMATFAANRRTPGGPVDHSLPVLAVHGADGKVRALMATYACHCTTLNSNLLGGDWAGYAQEALETRFPDCIALMTIGCGGDANPHPRGDEASAREHGREIATEVARLLDSPLKPLSQLPRGKLRRFDLPYEPLPTRQQWEEKARTPGIAGYHALKNLQRLDRGETLPAFLTYSVQTWTFGQDLAMVFLPGEVVVDYVLGLKKEFRNLQVAAYANDVPCYIPSARILQEGGYEGGDAMRYYDRPARLGPATEAIIFRETRQLLPEGFRIRN